MATKGPGKGHQARISRGSSNVFRIKHFAAIANIVDNDTATHCLHFLVKQPA